MPDLLLLDDCTLFLSQENGDVESRTPEGFFFSDVRHLSQWRVLVDGAPLKTLTSRAVDYFSGRVVAVPDGKDPPLTVERNRFVTDGAHEDIVVANHSPEHPDALASQAWAAAAPLLVLRTLLGLDVFDGKLRSRPHVPREFGQIRLKRIRCAGGSRALRVVAVLFHAYPLRPGDRWWRLAS